MSDTNLRSRIIRLAHSRPDLRPHLIPLVASSGRTAGNVDLVVGGRYTTLRPVQLAVGYDLVEAYGMPRPIYTDVPRGAELVFLKKKRGWGSDPGLEPEFSYPAKRVKGVLYGAGMWGTVSDTMLAPVGGPASVRVGDAAFVDRESIFYVPNWSRKYRLIPDGDVEGEVVAVDPSYEGGAVTVRVPYPNGRSVDYTVPASAVVTVR